jgi:hypothetical protein
MLRYIIENTAWWNKTYGVYPQGKIQQVLITNGAKNVKVYYKFKAKGMPATVVFSSDPKDLEKLHAAFYVEFKSHYSFSYKILEPNEVYKPRHEELNECLEKIMNRPKQNRHILKLFLIIEDFYNVLLLDNNEKAKQFLIQIIVHDEPKEIPIDYATVKYIKFPADV